ncbi:hypothetical protein ACO0LN_05770 [Undibacterium sp. TC9W]
MSDLLLINRRVDIGAVLNFYSSDMSLPFAARQKMEKERPQTIAGLSYFLSCSKAAIL